MSKLNLDLSNLVVTIRAELEEADLQMRAANKEALFELDSLELELKFLVEERTGVKGGFDLKILSAGADDDYKTEQVQTIRVKYSASESAKSSGVPGSRAHGGSKGGETKDIEPL